MAGDQMDGNRPLPWDRETLGRFAFEARTRAAFGWVDPGAWAERPEGSKEIDREVGEAVARWTLIGDAVRAAAGEDQ